VNTTDFFNLTALFWGCYYGHLSCVEVLLSKGAQADTGCLKTTNTIELDFFKDGVTSYDSPLSVARKRKHLQIIKMIESKTITLI
jgi:ankyrin repeat protein